MANLFDDEIFSVVMKFSNPNQRAMEDADKIASRMSLSLDGVIRKSLAAGKAVGEISTALREIEPALRKLDARTAESGSSSAAIRTAQKILARYTPQRMEKMADFQSSKVAETSGTASLRRELQNNGQLLQRMMATQQGMYERVSGKNQVGRALYIDTETTGLNELKHQVTEITANLFEFNKTTGEVLRTLKSYTGLQQPVNGGRNVRLSGGLTQEMLAGQAISTTVIRRMIQQADFVVAHNAPFDKKFVQRIIPSAASLPWLDSQRGIPWKDLGNRSRALQDLLRNYGINPGSAHRSGSDVNAGIQLLNSRSPLGGPRFMSMLLGNQGPLNSSQQTLAVIKQMTDELVSGLKDRLGSNRDWDSRSMRSRQNSGLDSGTIETFAKYLQGQIEGGATTVYSRRPARSTEYGTKYGSGQSEEATPGLIGPSAISIDRRLGTAESFLRNMSIMSGPASSGNFLSIYSKQQGYQEGLQRSRGTGRQIKNDIRSGDDVALATMQGVNTYLQNQRDIADGYSTHSDHNSNRYVEESIARSRHDQMSAMLDQPWAKPTRGFDSSEIDAFLAARKGNPSVGSIQTAAQMARHVGYTDPRYLALGQIMSEGQGVGRQQASSAAAAREQEILNRLSGSSSRRSGGGFRSVISGAMKSLADVGGSFSDAISQAAKGGTVSAMGGGFFTDMFSSFMGRRNARSAGMPGAASAAQMGDVVSPGEIRASMRRDTLEARLNRLAEAVASTTRTFEIFRDTTAPAKRAAAQSTHDSRLGALDSGLAGTNQSIDAQLSKLTNRYNRGGSGAKRRLDDIQNSFVSRSSELGFAQLDAEDSYENTLAATERRRKRLQKSKAYREGQLKDADITDQLSRPLKASQSKLTRAEYAFNASQITDPEELEALRAQTAQKLALNKYGRTADLAPQRDAYSSRVQDLLQGPTLAQSAETKAGKVTQDWAEKQNALTDQGVVLEAKKVTAAERATDKRAALESKLAATLGKIDDDVARKAASVEDKRAVASKKASEAIIAARKKEELILSGGGVGGRSGAGGGGRRSGGGRDEFSERNGLDFGIGLAALAAYNVALKELIKDSTVYAARTETLQLVTNQMAQVNGLNVKSIEDEVSAVKSLNITTQEANTVVQKMIFAQLDVAKATNLARVSQDAAILANVNSSEALDKIILGIVTGQTRVLHNMNLQVSMLQVMRELRAEKKSRGESGDPTELEKRQAMLNKVLMEGAKIVGTYERAMLSAGKQFNSLEREVQEAQNAIGKEFLPEFGRFVSLTTLGLHTVQENGSAFARLASILVSVGTAASTIGSLSFIKWMMTAPGVPWWAKLAGAAVGAGTYAALNQDDSTSLKDTAGEQQDLLKAKIVSLRNERKNLMLHKDDSAEWKNSWDLNTQALKSASDSQVAINEDLTQKLAEQYNKRLDDLDSYIRNMEGKSGFMSQMLSGFRTSPENSTVGSVLRNIPFFGSTAPEDLEEAKKQRSGLARQLSNGSISEDDIKTEADQQRRNKERLKLLSPTMLNKEQMAVRSIIADMRQSEGDLAKLDEKHSELGSLGLKARKSMGSPREKVNLDYEHQIAQVNKLGASLVDLKKKAATGDPKSASMLNAVYKDAGGGSYDVGRGKVNDFLDRQQEVAASVAEERDIQLSKINRQNQAQIIQIREQTAAARIQASVLEGNYSSEIAGIEKVFKLRQTTAQQVRAQTGDSDAYEKQLIQNQTDREIALINLEEKRAKARRQRQEDAAVAEGTFRGNRVLESPIGAVDALGQAATEELNATKAITDEDKRKNAQLEITLRLREALAKLAFDENKSDAEARVAEFENNQELQSEIDRIVNSHGRTNNERNFQEINRTRDAQIASANFRYDELKPVTEASGQRGLKDRRDDAITDANKKATIATVKELDAQVEAARGRVADIYQQRFAKIQRINELLAIGPAEEADAAYNTHRLRLEYINKEYEARGKTIEAEKSKNEQIQQAEFDHLQKLLELRKKDIEGVRNAAGSVFDAITSGNGLGSLIKDQVKSTSRTIFQNLAGIYLGDARRILGGIIPGQETTDANGKKKPTLLGRALGGTIFSPGADQKEIDRLLASVTKENTTAEQDLTKAVRDLTAAITAAKNGGSISVNSTATPPVMSTPYDLTGILRGSDSNNPSIMHLLGNNFTSGGDSSDDSSDDSGDPLAQLSGGTGGFRLPGGSSSSSSSSSTNSKSVSGLAGMLSGKTGKMVGGGLMAAGGVMEAIKGFGKGGAGGIANGIGGVLTSAAGITSMIPGAQIATPFLLGGAMVANLVGSLLGDSKVKRQREVDQYLQDTKYTDPVAISREMTVSGNLLGYNKQGLARDTGTGAFPIDVQQTVERQADRKWSLDNWGTYNPDYVTLPGKVLDKPNPPAQPPTQINYNVTLPVSAMDSQDVMRRSKDIVAAVSKEIRNGGDLGVSMQQAMFGAA